MRKKPPYYPRHSHTHTEKTPEICVHFSCSILLFDQADWLLLFHKATYAYIHFKSVSERLLKGLKNIAMLTTTECDKPTEASQCFSVFIAFFQLTYRILFFAVCKYVRLCVVFTT